MTLGENYELNKEIYNEEAKKYIMKFFKKNGDMAHRPFEMMTHYSRLICERLTIDLYMSFTGYVKEVKYGDGRKIERYIGKKDGAEIHTLKELIEMFGFEISMNPNSNANKLISANVAQRFGYEM